jgi:hypothetical protein
VLAGGAVGGGIVGGGTLAAGPVVEWIVAGWIVVDGMVVDVGAVVEGIVVGATVVAGAAVVGACAASARTGCVTVPASEPGASPAMPYWRIASRARRSKTGPAATAPNWLGCCGLSIITIIESCGFVAGKNPAKLAA